MYTVVSNSYLNLQESNFSVAIINRDNSPFISPLIDEINNFEVSEILLFNTRINPKKEWAPIKQIWTGEKQLNYGELVNIAIREAKTPYVLILWNNVRFVHTDLSSRLFLKIEEKGHLCTIPQLYSGSSENLYKLPIITKPIHNNHGFGIEHSMASKTDQKTFTPVDYIGFYNRQRFLNLGGYDSKIKNPYWQKADFSMRAAMWAEQIVFNPTINIYYKEENQTSDDDVLDLDARIFALKCLAPVMKRSGITLSFNHIKTVFGMPNMFGLFNDVKKFLKEYNFRFHYDAEQVVDQWNSN